MPPPASLHEETTFPERLDLPSKSYAEATLEPPADPNTLPNNPPEQPANKYTAVQSPGEYVGAGILDAPASPTRGHKRLSSRTSRGSLNGIKSPKKQRSSESDNIVYEKHSDGNGGQLTSVKSTEDYEKNVKQGEKEEKPTTNGTSSTKGDQELALTSGRVASAGWERSGYVD
jgi:2-acylglycerol O-acyltransferase 2